MEILNLQDGYDRTCRARLKFRNPVDLAEMIAHCTRERHIWFKANNGKARRCKVNGAVRTWKRDATRIEVPVKYGLYEYGVLTASDINRVLIPVD